MAARSYVAKHGMDRYIADEILPSLEAMEAAGFYVRAFAYPYGSRSHRIDRNLLPFVELLRTGTTNCPIW